MQGRYLGEGKKSSILVEVMLVRLAIGTPEAALSESLRCSVFIVPVGFVLEFAAEVGKLYYLLNVDSGDGVVWKALSM